MIKVIDIENGREILYESLTFSGGEPHIVIQGEVGESVRLICRATSTDDVVRLLVITDAVKRLGAKSIELVIPYFPAARQDRVCNKGEALTVKVYADLINSQRYSKVTIVDPHSDVVTALVENCSIMSLSDWTSKSIIPFKDSLAIAPDAGAMKKVSKVAKSLDLPFIWCSKNRNTSTGRIEGFSISDPEKIYNKHCYVFDDICDGGATFIGLGEKIRDYQPLSLNLVISHGIFSKGLRSLNKIYDSIHTTNSIFEKYEENPFLEKQIGKLKVHEVI